MIKSILGGKSKNLFDISKAEVTQHNVYWTSNADFTQHFYTQIVEPGKTYTVSYEYHNPLAGNDALSLSVQTGSGFYEGTRLYTGLIGNGKYKWVKQYGVFTIPNGVTQVTFSAFYDTMFRNLQLELGSTATEYVPHELTSYKSIMKVSDVCQLVDKSKFTASGTTNGITWVSNGDGSITLNGTCTSGFALNPFNQQIPVDQTHLYYSSPRVSINYGARIDGTYETGRIGFVKTSAFPTKFNTVFYIWIDEGKSFSNVTTFINIDDLTEMFGAGNEPKTVAEFKVKFPNDYYPYSPSCFVTSFDERMPCKTKNLFDKSNAQIINGYISGNNVFSASSLDKTIIVPCLPNTTYTFSKISVSPVACDRLRIGDYTAIPTIGDTINNVVNIGEPPTQNYITITTSDTAKYIVVTIGLFNYKVITTLDYILSTCQLELGTTATDYVPYGYV